MARPEDQFDPSRAELFEAIGHPMRIRILHVLEMRPMGFADLKREVGIESSGHLQFHLGKLMGMVGTTQDGSYTITDQGREAIRVLNIANLSSPKDEWGKNPVAVWHPTWAKPILAGLLIVIVILAGFVVYQYQGGLADQRATTIAELLPCTGGFVWSSSSNQSIVPVLLMQPNTTAFVCVLYQTYWMGNPTYNFTGTLGISTGIYKFTPFVISNESCSPRYGCGPVPNNNFRVSVNPTLVNLNAYTNYVSVLYTVTALANSTGYYSNSIPYLSCSSMPMAVGHSASNLNTSDFGPLLHPASCGFPPLYPVLVAVSGMGVAYLRS